jgi:hypothetical protein
VEEIEYAGSQWHHEIMARAVKEMNWAESIDIYKDRMGQKNFDVQWDAWLKFTPHANYLRRLWENVTGEKKSLQEYLALAAQLHFQDALKRGDFQKVEECLDQIIDHITDETVITTFETACKNGAVGVINKLKNNRRLTIDSSFEEACKNGVKATVRALMNNKRLTDNAFQLGFLFACQDKRYSSVELLSRSDRLSEKTVGAAFEDGCMENQLDIIDILLNHEKLTNADKKSGFEMACRQGHLPIARALLEEGNLSEEDIRSGLAAASKNTQMTELLEAHFERAKG